MTRLAALFWLALGLPALAQQGVIEVAPLDDPAPETELFTPDYSVPGFVPADRGDIGFRGEVIIPNIEEERAETAPGGVVRVLDRVSGRLSDVEMTNGQTTTMGRIEISLSECRYPADNPSSDAYAYLTIRNAGEAAQVFEGWMIASSPALNALDHSRYDVWVMRCTSS